MAVFPDSMVDNNGKKLRSFDEILDELLESKKNLASSALFPTEQAEVRPDELFGNVFGFNASATIETLTLHQFDRLNPNLFEAAIAALYENMGFEVQLTPYSNDKGVDVVVVGKEENYLLQVKQSKALIGKDAVQEVYTAKRYYETKFNMSFKLKVVTNSSYSSTAELLGQSNQVELIDRPKLLELLSKYEVSFRELNKLESRRLLKI
jgi:HJR/Mrr/RecB family endonuclease